MPALDDLRYAARTLSQAKAFTLAATAMLAIGIASATLMFALVNGILLAPLPVRDADQLIVAWKQTSTGTFSHYPFGSEAVQEVRENARSFERVGAFSYHGAMPFPAIENDVASYITTGVVDGHFFGVLDVAPRLGRTLVAADDAIGADRAPDIVGRRLRLFDDTFTIVGVVPPVDLPRGAQAWVTLRGGDARSTSPASRDALRRDHDLVARLRDGVTVAQATTELETLTAGPREARRPQHRGLGQTVH